jgi:DNA-directed RNA polymerase subunit RPC12/RpoP
MKIRNKYFVVQFGGFAALLLLLSILFSHDQILLMPIVFFAIGLPALFYTKTLKCAKCSKPIGEGPLLETTFSYNAGWPAKNCRFCGHKIE